MKFYPVTKKDLIHTSKNSHCSELYTDLLKFINSNDQLCRVEDDYYNNNNDLRRAIQSVIEVKNLPIHVFMKSGMTYIEKEL